MQPGLTMFCHWNGWFIVAMPDGTSSDVADVFNTVHWLQVLASPPLYGLLQRVPDRDHLLRLLDRYLAYAVRGQWYHRPIQGSPRVPLALELRTLLETWAPPDLPSGITNGARGLLDAEGIAAPPGGWDAFVNRCLEPVDDVLLWPEGIPVVIGALRAR